jgi:hypothetical protein
MKTTKNLLSIFFKKSKESTCNNITLSDIKRLGLLWGPKSPLLCATLCDIRRHWQFSKKSSMRRWAKLGEIIGDIRRIDCMLGKVQKLGAHGQN